MNVQIDGTDYVPKSELDALRGTLETVRPHRKSRSVQRGTPLETTLKPGEIERYWSKVHKTSFGCWTWTGRVNKWGYGQFDLYRGGRNRTALAHRIAYALTHGEIDPTLLVCHTCDNPACQNSEHLFIGTDMDNTRDRDRKGRGGDHSGEKNGNTRLTADQVRVIRVRLSDGERQVDLAREYSVTPQLIYQIGIGKAWRKVAGPIKGQLTHNQLWNGQAIA